MVDGGVGAAYAAGPPPGSVSNVLRDKFAPWPGWPAPADAALVVVLDADQDRAELVRQARNGGFEQILGELHGGVDTWAATGRRLDTIELVPAGRIDGTVGDVPPASEHDLTHLPGAVH